MANNEKDPSGKDAKQSGAKLDSGKSPVFRGLLDYFPRACMAVAEVSQKGAEKYCWKGWEDVNDGINRYSDAIARHICKESIEGKIDPDFGLLHKAHVAWNAMAVLELELRKAELSKAIPTPSTEIKFSQKVVEGIKTGLKLFAKDKDLTPGM